MAAPRVLKTLETLPEVQGTTRTDVYDSIGTRRGTGFSVDFQIIYEVHGAYKSSDKDNASLVVIRILPLVKKFKQQFLNFKVKLTVQTEDPDEDACHITSFEPACHGTEFFDIHTTNEEVQRMIQASIDANVAPVGGVGLQASNAKASSFTRTHLLHVTSRPGRDEPSLPARKYDHVLWEIRAANKDQGVGDSFTVALLIKRPSGTSFRLYADVDGDIGKWSAAKKKLDYVMRRHTEPHILASFPLIDFNSKVPPGIDVSNLQQSSEDNVLCNLDEIGLHLPELVQPVKANKGAVSATSLELSALKERPEAYEHVKLAVEDSPETKSIHTVPQPSRSATNVSHRVDTPPTSPTPARTSPRSRASDKDHLQSQSPEPTTTEALTSIMRDLSMLTHSLLRRDGLSPSPIVTSRIRRHREMANAHERLAELHREEAKEMELWEDAAHQKRQSV